MTKLFTIMCQTKTVKRW